MPVPHSWYTTSSRISTPARIMNRPTAPMTRAERHAGTIVSPRHGRPTGSRRRLGRLVARTSTLGASPWSPPSTSAPRSRSSAASRRSPASISTSTGARSCCSRAPTGPGKTHAAAHAGRACSRWSSGTAEVLGHDLRRDRRPVRRQVGLLGHATMLYDELTVADNVRFWARAARRRSGRRRGRPGGARASAAGCATWPWPVSRPASAGGPRSPCWWPADPSCGCSTSPTPASTPRPATSSTTSSAARPRRRAPP